MSNMLGVTLRDVRGPLADFNDKLAGENGEEWLKEFNKFLRKEPTWDSKAADWFRSTNELTIEIPALPRPTEKEMKDKFGIRSIERDDSPTEAAVFTLGTVLRTNEEFIEGKEYERRLPKNGFGYQHLVWLVEHQDENPSFKALLGKVYIDGTGIVVVDSYGYRYVPCLDRGGRRFGLYWHWISRRFRQRGRVSSPSSK